MSEKISDPFSQGEYWQICAGLMDGIKPEEILSVSEWADTHRYLAKGSSPEPGKYRTSRTPYLKKIMDSLSTHSSYKTIINKKASQIGASELGFNWIGYKIDISPGNFLMVMPTDGQVKRNSKMRIDPMIKATPRLAKKIIDTNTKDSSNTILQKDFPGGTLIMQGANSASGLASMPIENLMLDEVDRYPLDLSGEGSPIELAKARTRNFKRGKIFMPSTPTVKGISVIDAEYDKTDQQKYHMPCPHCGVMDHLRWENMRWEGDSVIHSPATTYYMCPHCEGKIVEYHKRDMLANGEWIAMAPENTSPLVIGFHLNALVSPWFTWAECVESFLGCGNDANKMKTFVNTILGECSETEGESPDWNAIYNKAYLIQDRKISNHVKFITAGIDVQKSYLAVQVVGWGHGKRRWVLSYKQIPGKYNEEEGWAALEKLLAEFWVREDGLEMPIKMAAIDSGAYTAEVYKFCKKFSRSFLVPVKGMEKLDRVFGNPSAANKTEAGKAAGSVMLYPVGSSFMKTELYGYLKLDKIDEDDLGPPGYIHLMKMEESYYKGLVAEEERVRMDKKGYQVKEWYKIYDRNEPLDTMNYARAAAAICGLDRKDDVWMDEISYTYQKKTPEEPKKTSDISLSTKEGGFWE